MEVLDSMIKVTNVALIDIEIIGSGIYFCAALQQSRLFRLLLYFHSSLNEPQKSESDIAYSHYRGLFFL